VLPGRRRRGIIGGTRPADAGKAADAARMLLQIGKLMALVGLVLAAAGGVLYVLGRLGVGRLPGDVSFGGKGWRVYVPIGTCILLSILLTLVLHLAARLRR
jgi:hypothetical protein